MSDEIRVGLMNSDDTKEFVPTVDRCPKCQGDDLGIVFGMDVPDKWGPNAGQGEFKQCFILSCASCSHSWEDPGQWVDAE